MEGVRGYTSSIRSSGWQVLPSVTSPSGIICTSGESVRAAGFRCSATQLNPSHGSIESFLLRVSSAFARLFGQSRRLRSLFVATINQNPTSPFSEFLPREHHVNKAAFQNCPKHRRHGTATPKAPTERNLNRWHQAAATAYFSQASQQQEGDRQCFVLAPFCSSAKASSNLQGASLFSPTEEAKADT